MNQNFTLSVGGAIVFVALNATLLQPLAYAQAPAKPDASQMKSGMEMKQGDMKQGDMKQGDMKQGDMKQGDMDMKGMKPGNMDMKGMMKGMSEKMSSMKMSGNPDVDFAMMMRIHHEGAIRMAEVELRDGKEASMKKMAKDIISAQRKEIAQIDKFINTHQNMPSKMTK